MEINDIMNEFGEKLKRYAICKLLDGEYCDTDFVNTVFDEVEEITNVTIEELARNFDCRFYQIVDNMQQQKDFAECDRD